MNSLNRGLDIMEYIVLNKCASVSEIAQAFQINKSTASRILAVLAEHDLVCKEGNTMKYYPSIGTLLYSSRTIANYQILDAIHPMLCSLAKTTNMTAQVCVLKHNAVILLDQVKSRSNRFLKEPALPGMTEPLHCSAIGKCILAYMPEEEYLKILDNYEFTKYTSNTIVEKEKLLDEMQQIRKDGYALDKGELYDNVFCMALPIYNEKGQVAYSVAVSGKKDFLENEKRFTFVLTEVKKIANKISEEYISAVISEAQGGK